MTRKTDKNNSSEYSRSFSEHSCVLLNRDFKTPADDWYHVVQLGEIPATAIEPNGQEKRVIQVINKQTIQKLADSFTGEEILIDYEHFSHDLNKETRAAGWITNVAPREDGLYAKIRWSAQGRSDVEGGVYRGISPEFDLFRILAGNRVEPLVLSGAGLTNRKNMKSLAPLSNRESGESKQTPTQRHMDYKELLLKVLGLTEDASDEDIQQAIDGQAADKSADSGAKEEELTALNSELEALRSDYADLALKGFEIEDKEAKSAIREALVQNREKGLLILNSMRDLTASKPGKRQQIFNRDDLKTPGTGKALGAAADADTKKAMAIRNRAQEIQRTDKCSHIEAWNRAESELSVSSK